MKRSRVRASLTDRRDLGGGLGQHPHFIFAKDAGLDGLHHQNALQHAAIDQRNAEERLVSIFAGFLEVLEAGMVFDLLHGDRTHLLGDQARQSFVDAHPQSANALRAKSEGRGQHQVGPVRFQQVGRTDVGLKPLGNQGDDVHQGLGGLAASFGEVADFLQRQDVTGIPSLCDLTHVLTFLVVWIQSRSRAEPFWLHFLF